MQIEIPKTSPAVRRAIVDLMGEAVSRGHALGADAEREGRTEQAWQYRKAADWISEARKEVKES